MIVRIFDKLIFGLTFILALQGPLLVDHYQQYLSGLYQATKFQVDGYERTAKQHQFEDLLSMIDRHLQNTEASVRTDARQKVATLALFADLKVGVDIFAEGNLFEKILFMLNPARYATLKGSIGNFKMGIPFTSSGLVFGLIFGLILNLLITWPFKRRAYQSRKS